MKQASNKSISSHRRQLYILLPILTLAVLACSYVLFKQIQWSAKLKEEKQSFAILEQDMRSLRDKFNAMEPGWQFEGECFTADNLTNVDVPKDCQLTVTNDDPYGNLQENFQDHLKKLENFGDQLKYSAGSFEDRNVNILSTRLIYAKNSSATCFIDYYSPINTQDRSGEYIRTVRCILPAHEFYYPKAN